jgi:predicted polyphosphate/ATP-dependent NAD kinase
VVQGSAPRQRRIGLIVNPVAGIGGRVGLKGSDGAEVQRRALELGAVPEAGGRARRALERLVPFAGDIELLVAPHEMGGLPALEARLAPVTIGEAVPGSTTAGDTRRIARQIRDAGAELVLFAGGDGTARDICDALGTSVPVLGIAAGVKVYSGVFAINPSRAGDLAVAFLRGQTTFLEGEVLDLDEEAYREGHVSPALHGYLRVPFRRDSLQGGKAPTPPGAGAAADEIARAVVDRMDPDRHYILGPGTTTLAIARLLGLPKTLVGVDVIRRGAIVLADANETQLAELTARVAATVIVTPIGGQGFIFGRGNPQIGPRVLEHVHREDILVVATGTKLAALHGRPLLVDTGDPAVDAALAGYLPVITGYRDSTVYRISA